MHTPPFPRHAESTDVHAGFVPARRQRRGVVWLLAAAMLACAAQSVAATSPLPRGPTPLPQQPRVLALGERHSCAVTAMGGVQCWGDNIIGQLGIGSSDSDAHPLPVDVVGLAEVVVALAAGRYHTCALGQSGAVYCWGDNFHGQLGDTTTSPRFQPVAVSGLSSGVAAIAANYNHTCALTTAGGVKCWGLNVYGQLGIGSDDSGSPGAVPHPAPLDVVGLASGATRIGAGNYHTCAALAAGGALCWGLNDSGQVGVGSIATTIHSTPQTVTSLATTVVGIDAGQSHSCAVLSNGGARCWGFNNWGQLGDNSETDRYAPVNVFGVTNDATQIAAGYGIHTCAVIGGGAKCWGFNGSGQLGDGTQTDRDTPTGVVGLGSGVVSIAAADRHSCAQLSGGAIKCWGDNFQGRLGNGGTGNSLVPVTVGGDPNAAPTPANDMSGVLEDAFVDLDVTDNDSDPDGNLVAGSVALACDDCIAPVHGGVVHLGGGVVRYTPSADYFGADTFRYEVCDSEGLCATADVSIDVVPVNDPPSFLPGPAQVFAGGTSGSQMVGGWASGADAGPGESGQSLLGYSVSLVNDPGAVVVGLPAISLAGDLTMVLSGASGEAAFSVTLQDDGGTADGGDDTSEPQLLRVAVGTAADLSVSMQACSRKVAPGRTFRFAVRLDNGGADSALDVVLDTLLPTGSDDIGVSNTHCIVDGTSVTCHLGLLAADDGEPVPLQVDLPGSGPATLTLVAQAMAGTADPAPGNNSASLAVQIEPSLVLGDSFESCDGNRL